MNIFDNKKRWLMALPVLAGAFLLSACDEVAVNKSGLDTVDRDVTDIDDTQVTSPALLALGDIGGNGVQDIAVVIDDPDNQKLTVSIKDINGQLVRNVGFTGQFRLLSAKAIPDLSGDGAMDLAVFGRHQTTGDLKVEIKESSTGSTVNDIWYNSQFKLLFTTSIPDMNDGAFPEVVALLEGTPPDNRLFAQINDPLTGNRVNNVFFNSEFTSRHLLALPDINASGFPELALLGRNAAGSYRTIIVDAGDKQVVSHKWHSNQFAVKQQALVPDMNGNSIEEIALLREGNSVSVMIYDAMSGERVSVVNFNAGFTPLKLVVIPDFSGNGEPELAVLGLNEQTGESKAEVRDADTGEFLNNVWWSQDYPALDMVTIPDVNNNGSDELVAVGKRESDGKIQVFVKDAETNQLIRTVGFSYQP